MTPQSEEKTSKTVISATPAIRLYLNLVTQNVALYELGDISTYLMLNRILSGFLVLKERERNDLMLALREYERAERKGI